MNPNLYADIYGEGQDLILLHGLFGSHENLRTLGKTLAQDYRIHALDLRNHGNSFHKNTMSYKEMANDILHYIGSKNIQKAYMLGHSMGGKVAMQTALLAPGLVTSLVVLDIAPVDYQQYNAGDRHHAILEGLKHITQAPIYRRSEADTALATYVKDASVRAFLLKNLQKSENGTFHLRLNIDAIIECYSDIAAAPEGQPYPHPALFIKGALSDYMLPAYREETLHLFPRAQLKVIQGTGHWLHAEKPDAVSLNIKQFLTT